jgi:TetR/AcrR family transcriptional regulator, transcriptional repressor of bet genes
MPRKVDHDERRRHIVAALLRIVGRQGLEAVSMREVAVEAGVSLGAVQHYFASKDAMLLFAMEQWLNLPIHEAFVQRVRDRIAREAAVTPAATLRAVAAEYLPHDEVSRSEARMSLAFRSRGAVEPALAAAIVPAYAGFVEALRTILRGAGPSLDAAAEARQLAAFLDGLHQPVLLGALSYDDALVMVERFIGRVTAEATGP